MDVSQVWQRVQAIADAAPDDEAQHSLEDQLFIDVLREIMNTSTDERSRALAGAALASHETIFERWCA